MFKARTWHQTCLTVPDSRSLPLASFTPVLMMQSAAHWEVKVRLTFSWQQLSVSPSVFWPCWVHWRLPEERTELTDLCNRFTGLVGRWYTHERLPQVETSTASQSARSIIMRGVAGEHRPLPPPVETTPIQWAVTLDEFDLQEKR